MKAIIFGAKGSIGSYVFDKFVSEGFEVYGTTTNSEKTSDRIIFVANDNLEALHLIDEIDIVVWANGANCNDNINTYIAPVFDGIIDANVSFILNTLKFLLSNNKLRNGAKLVIVSSIWEELTRDNKLSYTISKAALGGLVKSVSYDLSSQNILINNVLPGVIDNEMTRKTLNPVQLEYIKNYSHFARLVTLSDVYKTIKFLVTENTGITGQSIKVDLGFTNVKKYS